MNKVNPFPAIPFPLPPLSNLFIAFGATFEAILVAIEGHLFSKRNSKVCYYFFT